MNWINNVVRPKIRSFLTTKREVPENLWVKCPESGQMVFYKDLEANQFVVPGSNYHMRMSAPDRLKALFDGGSYERVAVPAMPLDPLKFRDSRRYTDRLKDAKADTGLDDAVLIGNGKLDGRPVVAAAQDFRFMAGSLGMAAGEAVLTGMLRAAEKRVPFILFAASGGARMQEGILSLMQMPRTTIAVQRLREAGSPYLVVLTDPTTGGVTASYAMLGDVHIAEPGALICFAGPRVIQQTIRENLPDGFQRAEYLLAHGMIDMVVHRHRLRETLSRLCALMTANTLKPEKEKGREEVRRTLNGKGNGAQHPTANGVAGSNGAKPVGDGTAPARGEVKVEPVADGERFVPTRGGPPAPAAGAGTTAASRPQTKDGARK